MILVAIKDGWVRLFNQAGVLLAAWECMSGDMHFNLGQQHLQGLLLATAKYYFPDEYRE